MKNYLLYLIVFILIGPACFSQSYIWAIHDTTQNSMGVSIAGDRFGNLLVAETFTYNGINNHASGINLIKYNSNHLIVWKQKLESWIEQAAICTDILGNVYLTSTFYTNTLLINGTPAAFGGGMVILKFNPQGTFQWLKKSVGQASGIAVNTDANKNVYVVGNFVDSAFFDGVKITSPSVNQNYIVKYDSMGVLKWVRHGSQDHFGMPQAKTDYHGNTYISGTFIRTVKFGNISLTAYYPNGSQEDIFIAKIDSSGNWIWAKHAGGDDQDVASGITVDEKGNLFVTGFIGSTTATFGTYTLINTGGDDFFIAKYDTAGNVLWATNGGGPGSQMGDDICVDKKGFVYLGTNSKFINKFDSLGNYIWWQHQPVSNNAMVADDSGAVYITGAFQNSVSFDNCIVTASQPNTDQMYIVKFSNAANQSGIHQIQNDATFSVYPNPSNHLITVSCTSDQRPVTLVVKNSLGQPVYKEILKEFSGSFTKQIDLGFLPKGIYFVELLQDNIHSTKKIILN